MAAPCGMACDLFRFQSHIKYVINLYKQHIFSAFSKYRGLHTISRHHCDVELCRYPPLLSLQRIIRTQQVHQDRDGPTPQAKRSYQSSKKEATRRRLVLGIETSCDETGAAVVDECGSIVGECLHSQKEIHSKNGGIIPPVAQALHEQYIDHVVQNAMDAANIKWTDLSAVATTIMPGLALSLSVGLQYSKDVIKKTGLPFIPVHHMEAHALTIRMVERVEFPFLVFLVSGGHCIIAVARDLGNYLILGQTKDDAPGEAYDKIARKLKLNEHPQCIGMSGGQAIEHLAQTGDREVMKAYTPNLQSKDCTFSFSGVKSMVSQFISKEEKIQDVQAAQLSNINDIAAAFQFKVTHQLVKKIARAMIYCKENSLIDTCHQTMVLSGGVASNGYIRNAMQYVCNEYGYRFLCPPPKLCTDNGTMIAWTGMERLKRNIGIANEVQNIRYEPKYPLGEDISDQVKAEQITVPSIQFWKKCY
ncbi:tRNA N6-adenosine threonylcarbamoyltransferase, mitochondrial-like [Saccoglossus kowalevskii]|uniref:N(6)-L-threonylcarbamoyladenine synthase n=1 Tax=Saccoglossus kowalevskii TaxID=10224 RepID=A0ABM0GTV7_SACKO|nr:PREDICTED: probable tRNA N6-adenosine threonylcarbamoyltransferase, mitochondrial-like [Saccoglossus kowalevskii]